MYKIIIMCTYVLTYLAIFNQILCYYVYNSQYTINMEGFARLNLWEKFCGVLHLKYLNNRLYEVPVSIYGKNLLLLKTTKTVKDWPNESFHTYGTHTNMFFI